MENTNLRQKRFSRKFLKEQIEIDKKTAFKITLISKAQKTLCYVIS